MGKDIIKQSFKALQDAEPVNGGGFIVEPMNKCIEDAHLLPPLVSLYPDIVLEGDLSIIFGQSGIGKTIFAMQIARYIAEQGKRVLYVDCEMTPRQLYLRTVWHWQDNLCYADSKIYCRTRQASIICGLRNDTPSTW